NERPIPLDKDTNVHVTIQLDHVRRGSRPQRGRRCALHPTHKKPRPPALGHGKPRTRTRTRTRTRGLSTPWTPDQARPGPGSESSQASFRHTPRADEASPAGE